jgi:hypothetical protein
MLKSMQLFLLVMTICASVSGESSMPKPPTVFMDEGACPFECCVYRDWHVTKATKIFDKPKGKNLVARLKVGDVVHAKTGIVYVVPSKIKVVYAYQNEHNQQKYSLGETIYLLTYLGEGAYKIWHNGEVIEEGLEFLDNALEKYDGCFFPSSECWGRLMEDHRKEDIWWVKLEIKDGTIGWAEVDNNFNPMDMDKCS